MPSTATTSLRLELQASGENLNSWGTRLNDDVTLLEQAIAGVITKSLTGNVSLTATNYASDESRNMVIKFTDGGLGSAPTVTIPAVDKLYLIHNAGATYNVNVSAGGVAAAVRPGILSLVYCDGTDCFVVDPTLDKVKAPTAAVALNSQQITGLAAGSADTHAVNRLQVTQITSGHRDVAGGFAAMATGQAQHAETQAAASAVSAAAASSSASTASTQASNASTSASNASTSASNAATSETNAATSASTASTQATNASNSATTASTQATNAATSASTATTQASNASTSASTATTQASNASTSASNASTSASNAATSETNAANSAIAAAASAASIDIYNLTLGSQVFG